MELENRNFYDQPMFNTSVNYHYDFLFAWDFLLRVNMSFLRKRRLASEPKTSILSRSIIEMRSMS